MMMMMGFQSSCCLGLVQPVASTPRHAAGGTIGGRDYMIDLNPHAGPCALHDTGSIPYTTGQYITK